MEIEKYSLGIGDRFGMEGLAQLRALQKAKASGIQIVPVWNKSYREHTIIGTSPADARREADDAVKSCRWSDSYYVDADHISLATVDKFLGVSDFFTIDVADYIGKSASTESMASFNKAMQHLRGSLIIPGMQSPIVVTTELLSGVAQKYLVAIEEAARVHRHIADKKGVANFVTEISVDEANIPQTPGELFFILAMIAQERIPVQTIAPKFTGSFLKGVDYVGNIQQFTREFQDDLAVISYAVQTLGLPRTLKLSVHSGSDKFSLYPILHRSIKEFGAGLHLKTAGTTWLEEVIGLAASGGEGLRLVKEVYTEAYRRFDELCKPYLSVICIDKQKLPAPEEIASWTETDYVQALQHDQACPGFDPQFRQLVHIGYRIAAEMAGRYTGLLRQCRKEIEMNVTKNLYERHIVPLFLGEHSSSQSRSSKIPSTASAAV